MKPSKEINTFPEPFLLTLSLVQWTQFEWVQWEKYLDRIISFMDSLEPEIIMLKVIIQKVAIN